MTVVDTTIHDQVRADLDANDVIETSETEHSPQGEFNEICQRLDDWLPKVDESPGWDPLEVKAEFKSHIATDQSNPEIRLGIAICELADSVHSELVSSATELYRSRLDEVLEQINSDEDPEPPTCHAMETVETCDTHCPTPHMTSQVRPFRNLFSMLRRKQKGLV
jgi:hypothetical protein